MRTLSSLSSLSSLPTLLVALSLVACGDKDQDTARYGGGGGPEDADGDGFSIEEDCDDADASVYPGADELCDGVDNDCDDEVDEAAVDASLWYADADGDGHGDASGVASACVAPSGYVAEPDDCDDADAAVSPDADELCDGVDNDCDGDVDEPDAADAATWYGDGDADGYGDADRTQTACSQPVGFVDDDTDCNDQSDAAYPGAEEICDGLDNDCNGETDEDASADAVTWYADLDGDGFGDPGVAVTQCAQPTDHVLDGTDCDDAQSTTNPGASEYCDGVDNDCDGTVDEDDALDTSTWYADADGDGYGDASTSVQTCDPPSGHVADDTDCDDGDGAVNPGATEVCNEIDDDCDGDADDADGSLDFSTATTWYADADGDGYGDPAATALSCDAPSGYLSDNADCDDGDAAVNPAATEVCNEIDDDCDGDTDDADGSLDATTGDTFYIDADGDGFGDPGTTTQACEEPTGYASVDTDCDDGDGAVHPSATEVCDEIDNDCDGDVDDADGSLDTTTGSTFYADTDGDGFGDAGAAIQACDQPTGAVTDATDCDDTSTTTFPGADEYCNTADDDCDGTVDEDDALDALTWYADTDGDGFGDASSTAPACSQPSGYVADPTDCDDARGGVNPGASEICNELDDDCDGMIDDDDPGVDATTGDTFYADVDGDGYGSLLASLQACEQPSGFVDDSTDCDDSDGSTNPAADEYCDLVDNDCDGTTDESDAVDAATWYRDDDGDGYGNAVSSTAACSEPSGYVADDTDCNDADGTISPGTAEIWYDGIDSDCGADSDYDADGDGYESESYTGTDCDDGDAAVSPAAAEIWYDGVDQDCDDASDYDADADGYDSLDHGGDDCNDADAAVYPGVSEVWYDGIDADCDGTPDNDADGDGFDAATAGGSDCDDTDHTIHPYAYDVSDGVDNDCDGTADNPGGSSVSLGDDTTSYRSFSFSFPFCGATYGGLYVGSNGILYFDAPSTDFSETESEFVGSRGDAIAAFWDDLNPSSSGGGTVYTEDFGDAFGVYYEEVTEFSHSTTNTFYTVIFDDGTILQGWNGMDADDGLVGWTCGTGVSGAVDLSDELAGLSGGDTMVGDGTEDAVYELFYSANPMDLDGELIWYEAAP
jgi:hypothetical protein